MRILYPFISAFCISAPLGASLGMGFLGTTLLGIGILSALEYLVGA